MKIAMFGPGYGHNIQPYLEFFERSEEYALYFYYHTRKDHVNQYSNICFIGLLKGFFHFVVNVRSYDVIWVMGGGRLLYVISIAQLFKKRSSLSILNIWSESLPRLINEKSLKGKWCRMFVSLFSIINCNWFGTKQIIKNKLSKKVKVNPLGLIDAYYYRDKPDENLEKILKSIDKDSYNFFYPKSFTSASRHDLVVEAVDFIRNEVNGKFRVYFLEGNVVDFKRKKDIINLIIDKGLGDYFCFIETNKYLSPMELNLVWDRMDCGLQIAQFDQISNTVFEPLINQKELIISDIPPYHFIKEFFGFDIVLTELDPKAISRRMLCLVQGACCTSAIKKREIKEKIREVYSFDSNFKKFLIEIEKRLQGWE